MSVTALYVEMFHAKLIITRFLVPCTVRVRYLLTHYLQREQQQQQRPAADHGAGAGAGDLEHARLVEVADSLISLID